MGFICSVVWDLVVPRLRSDNCPTLLFYTPSASGRSRENLKIQMKRFSLPVLALLLSLAGSLSAQNLPSYVPANGLVGWWPFNGNANDESGNNIVLSNFGPVLTTDRFGAANSAYLFDSTQYFFRNTPITTGGDFSVSLWFFKKSTNGGDLWNETSSNSTTGGNFTCNNGLLQFICQGINMNVTGSTFTPSLSTWTNLTLTKSGNQFTFFIDGELNSTGNSPYSPYNSSTYFALGNSQLSTGSSGINGKIDDIAIYNRALSQQEITALYQGANSTTNCPTFPASLTQGLVGYWPFCGNANDESGNGHHGTPVNVSFSNDRFGNPNSAANFPNGNTTSEIMIGTELNPSVFSISAWVRQTGQRSDGFHTVITKIDQVTPPILPPNNFLIQQSAPDPSQSLAFGLGGNNLWQLGGNFGSGSVSLNDWHHIVATFNGSISRTFCDGILKDSSIIQDFYNPASFLSIGDRHNGPNIEFNWWGDLDDIAIWNRALSQSEISQLYNQGICQTSITVTDTLLIHTGITAYNPVAYQNTLKVWPNPGNQDITLDAGNLSSMQGWKYKVANGLGQMVVNETAISQQQTLINLSTWGGNGIYYLHLINPQGIAVEIKKIVLAP